MMFRLFSTFCLFSVVSAQLRGLADPKSVHVKECVPKEGVEFMSQYAEDQTIYESYFKNKCDGTVVEMGGYDGLTFSNSWYFQYALGWRTLLVEAFPKNFEQLIINRPDSINVNAAMCLGDSIGFQVGSHPATGGAAKDMSKKHKETWTDTSTGVVEVPCKQVSRLLVENNIEHVDLFFLDVEGAELTVLQTIDWGRVEIDMFVIEFDGSNLLKQAAIRAFLAVYGYVTPFSMLEECSKIQKQCMPSELFVKQEVLENMLTK